jgi:serine phosphatase RsbU (regulator of sigma subunit)
MSTTTRDLLRARWRDFRERVLSLSPLRNDVASNGPTWLPLVLVLGATAAVAYADHLVVSISLVYLYILPLGVGAIFLRREVSYCLVVACVMLHDYDSPRKIHAGLRIVDNLTAMACFTFVVYFIQRYIEQREALARTVQQQRDRLLQDLELAAQVQRLFLPTGKPAIAGLDIAGMMQPARRVGGDYYDYIPIGAHTIEIVVGDVAGKGIAAALLMSATAAVMQLEANRDRNLLELVGRLDKEISSLSDGERYVTLLLAEIDVCKRTVRYVNCGHNPALLFRAADGMVACMDSSCPPIGMFSEPPCELASADLTAGDVMVFYTDGVTEAENQFGEEFGIERLSAIVRRDLSLPADELMVNIFRSAAHFCGESGFTDDVTILVIKCQFDDSPIVTSSSSKPGASYGLVLPV